jgi:2-polyprenyl-6-methoxyphenol hydroxylase-like FAD-dependent oxidoreductase
MGTSIAMVGAYVLAGELKTTGGDHGKAFANYEAAMREFVNEAQKMAEGVSWFIPQTRLKLWFSEKLWSWLPRSTLRKMMIEEPARIASLVELKEYK